MTAHTTGMYRRRTLAAVCGTLAGLGGLTHAVGEIRQGSGRPAGLFFESWTDGRVAENLGGEPGMSLIPDVLASGLATAGISVAVVVAAARFVDRRHGPAALAAASTLMLLTGGGVGPPVLGMLSALVAQGVPVHWIRPGSRRARALRRVWPGLFWFCLADTAFLVLGSLVVGVGLDQDISEAFVYALFAAVLAMPAAALAGALADPWADADADAGAAGPDTGQSRAVRRAWWLP